MHDIERGIYITKMVSNKLNSLYTLINHFSSDSTFEVKKVEIKHFLINKKHEILRIYVCMHFARNTYNALMHMLHANNNKRKCVNADNCNNCITLTVSMYQN